jgi:hypothetical protein
MNHCESHSTSYVPAMMQHRLQGRPIAEAVSRWLLTAAARFEPGSGHVVFVVDKVALGQLLSEYFGLIPLRIMIKKHSLYS